MGCILFSRGSSRLKPDSSTLQADSLLSDPPGKPINSHKTPKSYSLFGHQTAESHCQVAAPLRRLVLCRSEASVLCLCPHPIHLLPGALAARFSLQCLPLHQGFPGAPDSKEFACNTETWVRSLGREDSLEKGMATHSSVLTWRVPMDREVWQATVHGVAKEWDKSECLTLSLFHFTPGSSRSYQH